MNNNATTLLLSILFLTVPVSAFGQQESQPDDLALYVDWLEKESRDSAYHTASRDFEKSGAVATVEDGIPVSSGESFGNQQVAELAALSATFTKAFWVEKDYDGAFYIGFQLEEKLPKVSDNDYPHKRRDYFKLGEAYYLFLDNHKSIALLEKALAPVPLSFADRTNLDALKIIGICYANIGAWQKSDDYFRATLLSNNLVLDRPLYNAYAISHLGCNAMLTGYYDRALRLSTAVWPALRQTDDYGHLAGMCYCRGRSHLQKGDFKQASTWADSLIYFAHKDQYNQTKRIKQAYLLKADYYTAMGDARQAKIYNDSLVGVYVTGERENTSQHVIRAAQKYNNLKIAMQSAQLSARRTYIIIASVIALLCLVVSFIIWSLYRKKNAAYKALAIKAEEWAGKDEVVLPLPSKPCAEVTPEDKRIMSLLEGEMQKHAYREEGLTVEMLADRIGIHRNALSHAINRTTAGNYNAYINSFRIKEAVRIISQTSRKELYIDELYERVGFGSRSSFSRVFKQFTGLSPLELQKQEGKNSSLPDFNV